MAGRLERRVQAGDSFDIVRFGMDDVDRTIQSVMARLKEKTRGALTDLTWEYLRDLISGEDQGFDQVLLQQLERGALDAMFRGR